MATLSDAFISLDHIINNFLISYTGPGKLIPDAKRTEVMFHARRCLQEFAYETLKSQMNELKTLPTATTIPAGSGITASRYVMPSDAISTIKIIRADASGTGGVLNTVMTQGLDNPPLNDTTYYIDYPNKTINFTGLANYKISYDYLSNALTTDETAAIPKLAEEALYACMVYAILANREGTDGNLLQRLLIEKIDRLEKSKSRLIFTNFS